MHMISAIVLRQNGREGVKFMIIIKENRVYYLWQVNKMKKKLNKSERVYVHTHFRASKPGTFFILI